MTQPIEPREAEAMAVTLGRVDIKVDNILEKVTEVRAEVIQHRERLGTAESKIQQLQSDQRAAEKAVADADKAREDTAAALEKQTAGMVAKAKDAVDAATRESAQSASKSASTWAPRNFAIAFAALVVAALGVYVAFKFGSAIKP